MLFERSMLSLSPSARRFHRLPISPSKTSLPYSRGCHCNWSQILHQFEWESNTPRMILKWPHPTLTNRTTWGDSDRVLRYRATNMIKTSVLLVNACMENIYSLQRSGIPSFLPIFSYTAVSVVNLWLIRNGVVSLGARDWGCSTLYLTPPPYPP